MDQSNVDLREKAMQFALATGATTREDFMPMTREIFLLLMGADPVLDVQMVRDDNVVPMFAPEKPTPPELVESFDETKNEKDWPHNPDYSCSCNYCAAPFAGPKRAPFCWSCAPSLIKQSWLVEPTGGR